MNSIAEVAKRGMARKEANARAGLSFLGSMAKRLAFPAVKGYAASEGANNLYEARTGEPLSDAARNALWLLGGAGGMKSKALRGMGLSRRAAQNANRLTNSAAVYGVGSSYVKDGINRRVGANIFNDKEREARFDELLNRGKAAFEQSSGTKLPDTFPSAWKPTQVSNSDQSGRGDFRSYAREAASKFLQSNNPIPEI